MKEDPKSILLHVKDLKVQFKSGDRTTTAVDGISFELRKGEILGIVGESGSGKSITALSINQLIRSIPNARQSGEIIFKLEDSINLTSATDKKLQKIRGRSVSMIFQEPMTSLNPVMKCGKQIDEVLQLHQAIGKKDRKHKVLALLREVKIEDAERIYEAYPNEISGGQKQRVMIAMAMACQPQLLIADEPTTALDVTIQRAIIDLMQELQQRSGMAIIFISHDLNLVAEIADRVLVMKEGRIIEQGRVADIFQSSKKAYTMSLLASRPPLDKRLKRLPEMKDFSNETVIKAGNIRQLLNELEDGESPDKEHEKRILLNVEELKVWFPVRKNWLDFHPKFVKAVDGVSFQLREGEILGLVGESGSGKTSLGRALVRLVEANQGAIWFEGQEVRRLNRSQLKKLRTQIQIIFQDPYASLNPRMSVGQAIMEPLRVHNYVGSKKAGEQEVYRLLELVGLEREHYNRFPNEFSGGQRQRIGIARALAARPKMLICDESVASLDVSIQAQILNLLKALKENHGLSILFISHDLAVIKFLSERMIVMQNGRIVEQGPSDEIYQKPQKEYTKKLIAAIPKGIGY